MMKYFFFLVLLPCLSASEKKHITCPNGNQCPFGKTCCGMSDGVPGCCDLPKEDLEDKRLVVASSASVAGSVSMTAPENLQGPCYGTLCGTHCHTDFKGGVCCENKKYACPDGSHCCTNYFYQPAWCCLNKERCHSDYGYCRSTAASTSTAVASTLFAFLLWVVHSVFSRVLK